MTESADLQGAGKCSVPVNIRLSQTADLKNITAIYDHHVRHGTGSFETEPPTYDEMVHRHTRLLEQGYPYLVAEQEGQTAGYAYAGPYRPRAAYRDTVENSVYIRPDLMGQGIGSQLLAALINACEPKGFRQMVAVVGDSANIASVRLHEAHGFCNVGTLKSVGFKHGRWLDTVLLQRGLGDSDETLPARILTDNTHIRY